MKPAVTWLSRSWPRTATEWTHIATRVLSVLVLAGMTAFVLQPIFRNPTLLGGHDWDTTEAYRHLVVKTIRRFHQFPFWNPYTCGGHPVWGGVESDSMIVSPFFPVYLVLSLPLAMRVELVGSALLSMIGTWLFAGRFTRSPAVKAFVVAVFSINGRWALQAAAGHTWHLSYEWVPWTLYFLDRAATRAAIPGSRQFASAPPALSAAPLLPALDIIGAGVSMALMVYTGGIYPLPHAALLLALYGAFAFARNGDPRPLLCTAAAGLVALGLSAPKLFPTLEVFSRFPRFTDSTEWMDLGLLWAILTSPDQGFGSHPAPTPQWGWHEWGMYIGVLPVAVLVLGLAVARGPRLSPWKWTALALLALGFGALHPYAPWSILHRMSLFRSHHVPSRWLYPSLLVAAGVAAAVIERGLVRVGRLRPFAEIVALLVAAYTARDVGTVARLPLASAFEREPPRAKESTGTFHTEVHMPGEIGYPVGGDWAPNTLPLVIANLGTTDCGSFFQFHNYYRDQHNHTPGLGAKGQGEPGYRGEAFVVEGNGSASITSWTPNEVTVAVTGAKPGDHVAIDQNYDPGWSANGRAAVPLDDLTTAVVREGETKLVFRYRPPWLWTGIGVFMASVAGIAWYFLLAAKIARVRRASAPGE
ncbi:MAG: hypothetical protein FWD17_00430 [Polyangiaceae bacterium]|nr:hypothetical protein [Polyangiaceae bacterium]